MMRSTNPSVDFQSHETILLHQIVQLSEYRDALPDVLKNMRTKVISKIPERSENRNAGYFYLHAKNQYEILMKLSNRECFIETCDLQWQQSEEIIFRTFKQKSV
jgi:hypothetical protein